MKSTTFIAIAATILPLVASNSSNFTASAAGDSGETFCGITSVAVQNPPRHPQYGVFTGIDDIETRLYDLAIDEMVQNLEADGTFRTGKLWGGVWTRDVSYSAMLSLAHVEPGTIHTSLMKKVDCLGRIIQDTGTGGSWPCSIDRVVWFPAAYELWLETGDRQWLEQIYKIADRSVRDDYASAFDPSLGLFRGESSFIDWRKQSYPLWMDCKDIAQSVCLGTNAVYYITLRALEDAAARLGNKTGAADYAAKAEALKAAVNRHLWMKDKGWYAQYLYGRNNMTLSPRSETLGEALCIISGIASPKQAEEIFSKMPVSQYGPTIFWPQIETQGAYHNNGIWPFVTAFWGIAAARCSNLEAIELAVRSSARISAVYGSNYENFKSSDGTNNTLLNSQRQLWSIAGYIGLCRHALMGIRYTPDGIAFAPAVPACLKGERSIKGMKYRDMTLDVCVRGEGAEIGSFLLDGKAVKEAFVPASLTGRHSVIIEMKKGRKNGRPLNLREYTCDLRTPEATADASLLKWASVPGADHYRIFFNGKLMAGKVEALSFEMKGNGEYAVMAANAAGLESFISEPVRHYSVCLESPCEVKLDNSLRTQASVTVEIPASGLYAIDCNYSNGNGEIETHNKCATRTLYVDGAPAGRIVMPQRGTDWSDAGWSTPMQVKLTKGTHSFELRYLEENVNMNIDTDEALLHSFRFTAL